VSARARSPSGRKAMVGRHRLPSVFAGKLSTDRRFNGAHEAVGLSTEGGNVVLRGGSAVGQRLLAVALVSPQNHLPPDGPILP
jgi:hypothetical protein